MTSDSASRLGYVGLGNIGGPMAGRLAKWQGGLTVFDLSPDAVVKVVDQGARAASSLSELAASSDIIGICVRDDAQVRTVVTGLLEGTAPGTIVTVHSTISPETAVDLAAVCAEREVTLLDAPISGGTPGAEQGRLAVMVGGPRDAYVRLKEPFALTSDMLVHAGDDVGAGTKMKLARNLLHFISFAATAEASRLAQAAGIDVAKLGKVVRHTDAITGGAHDDFTFVGNAAFTAAGQVRWEARGDNTVVQVNVDGSPGADMSILLQGVHSLTAGDFKLS